MKPHELVACKNCGEYIFRINMRWTHVSNGRTNCFIRMRAAPHRKLGIWVKWIRKPLAECRYCQSVIRNEGLFDWTHADEQGRFCPGEPQRAEPSVLSKDNFPVDDQQ